MKFYHRGNTQWPTVEICLNVLIGEIIPQTAVAGATLNLHLCLSLELESLLIIR